MRSLIPFRLRPARHGRQPGFGRAEPPLTRQKVAHDPSPSLWAYRMQRVMLTPYLRAFLRVGLPVLAVAAMAGVYMSGEDRRNSVVQVFTDLREKFQSRPEFMVTLVSIEGSSVELADAVRARLDLNLPQSSFDLDLEAARARVVELDAVKGVELRVRSGGVLSVLITERQPVLVWRQASGLSLVDETGHRVAGLFERADRDDLPLIAGEGADAAAPEALEILAAAGPIAPRIRGLVRMGERRWDIVLDRGQRILLPEDRPVRALERLLALDQAQDMLARDLVAVDLRLPNRPTLRLTTYAMNELRRAKGLQPLPETVETEL
ncbi:cell division protein FtsQ/DivIB [Paracoccus sp. IB05]|uniref:cell division protein FtsQ/DivIB n=1 Tax=Paracoccus sp. IB05 TaxID=2779367 RepID=UPI0018E7DBC2|nr:cell division protein FtsQ/DivIB [Paracoccus sp. IB05]MBJ2153500.1 cell division protein FtsQ/DivIB [Paracoccus sp. IB05]